MIQIPVVVSTISIPAIRSLAGLLNNALEDKKLDRFEIAQLISTEFRIIVGGVALYYGLNLFGFDIDLIAPLVGTAIVDWFVKVYAKRSSSDKK